jgi:hypothetical protein
LADSFYLDTGGPMPTTIAEAFATVRLVEGIVSVRWGTKPATSEPGVYIVSLTESLDTYDGKLMEAPTLSGRLAQGKLMEYVALAKRKRRYQLAACLVRRLTTLSWLVNCRIPESSRGEGASIDTIIHKHPVGIRDRRACRVSLAGLLQECRLADSQDNAGQPRHETPGPPSGVFLWPQPGDAAHA